MEKVISKHDGFHLHHFYAIVHPYEFVQDFFAVRVDHRHSRDAHTAGCVDHLAVQSYDFQSSVPGCAGTVWGSGPGERMPSM